MEDAITIPAVAEVELEEARPKGSRTVNLHLVPCINITPYTWLQYHSTLIGNQRNRLALLGTPQLMQYANLHFHQITTFRQVEMVSLTNKEYGVALNKAVNVAHNSLKKKKNKRYTIARMGSEEDLSGGSASSSSANDDDASLSNSESTSSYNLKASSTVSSLAAIQEDKAAASPDPREAQEAGPESPSPAGVGVAGEAKQEDSSSAKSDDALALSGTTTAPADGDGHSGGDKEEEEEEEEGGGDQEEQQEKDDFDDEEMLRLFATLPGAHVVDASLNRLRSLQLDQVKQWNVACVMFCNLSGNLLASLEGIENCRNLRVLDASDNLLVDMRPLKGCRHLKRLRINGNRLVSVGLTLPSAIVAASPHGSESGGDAAGGDPDTFFHLEYLDINDNRLDSAEGLRGLRSFGRSLIHLEMRNCNLATSAFSEIAGCWKLESLHADNNKFKHLNEMLPALRALRHLKHLSLMGNPVATVSQGPANSTGAAAESKGRSPRADQQQRSRYAISIFDNVSTLTTFDHLAVPVSLYDDLARMKGEAIAEDLLADVSSRYSAEISAVNRVRDNLVQRHRMDEELVEQAVKRQSQRLEDELEELLVFGHDQLVKMRLKPIFEGKQESPTYNSPEALLGSIRAKIEETSVSKK